MPASQQSITDTTPIGATLVDGGATFRVWAPEAKQVYVITRDLAAARMPGWTPREADLLTAAGPPLHGFRSSASMTIPANGLLVFARV